ncbi:hypothetical protein AB0A73_09625 [Glycomyces sp. NPDC047369]
MTRRTAPRQTRPRRARALAAAASALGALALLTTACDADSVTGRGVDSHAGVFYGLGDDHRLYRWDVDGDEAEPVLDLSGAWDAEGDVGTVLRSSLSIDPRQRTAAWIEGAGPDAVLKFGNLDSGEITTAASYPLDHACIDPTWLPDGSALLVHRAAVWGTETAEGDATPLPVESWGDTEWYSPDAGQLPTTVDLSQPGCRVRWYTADDGGAQALYHDLQLTQFYRIDTEGTVLDTVSIPGLTGTEPLTIGFVGTDPAGRYACVVDGYGPYGAFKGGFTIRAESGTRVVDLETGEAVGSEDSASCTSLHDDGYVSRNGATAAFIGYDGSAKWSADLPDAIKESPVLFFYPDGSE